MSEKWSLTKDATLESEYISSLRTLVSDKRESIPLNDLPKEFKPLKLSYEETTKRIVQLLKKISDSLEHKSYENIFLKGDLINKICVELINENSIDYLKKITNQTLKELDSKKISEESKALLNNILSVLEEDLDKTKRKLALLDPICAGLAY